MRALVKYESGAKKLELRDIERPSPQSDDVVIEVHRCGICGSDLHVYYNDNPIQMNPPVTTGHEFSGVVVEIGDDVRNWKVGDHVVSETSIAVCGTCEPCTTGHHNLCANRKVLGYWYNGAFARYVSVPSARLHAVPDNVDLRDAALTEPLACVVHAVVEQTRIDSGDTVVVTGPGAIGLLAAQVARACGATVIVVGSQQDGARLSAARSLGAAETITVSASEQSPAGDLSADVVLECSGNAQAAQYGLRNVKRRGRFTQIGLFGVPVTVPLDVVVTKEISVVGAMSSLPSSWERALQLLAEGAVRVDPIVSHVLPLSRWKEAFAMFERREGIKILLDPNE